MCFFAWLKGNKEVGKGKKYKVSVLDGIKKRKKEEKLQKLSVYGIKVMKINVKKYLPNIIIK